MGTVGCQRFLCSAAPCTVPPQTSAPGGQDSVCPTHAWPQPVEDGLQDPSLTKHILSLLTHNHWPLSTQGRLRERGVLSCAFVGLCGLKIEQWSFYWGLRCYLYYCAQRQTLAFIIHGSNVLEHWLPDFVCKYLLSSNWGHLTLNVQTY